MQNGDASVSEGIQLQLLDLMSAAQRRLIALKVKTGTGVVLLDSNQSQGQGVLRNMCSGSVSADSTAGPNHHLFSMSFDNESEEGEETITKTTANGSRMCLRVARVAVLSIVSCNNCF